jgi:hypothetical protein
MADRRRCDENIGPRFCPFGRRMGPQNYEAFLGALREIEELLQFPETAGNVDKANMLAMSIAGTTAPGPICDLALKVISEANALRDGVSDRTRLNDALWHLRLALQEAKARAPQ